MSSTKDSLNLYLHKKKLSDEEFQAISFLIKNENKDSILSKLKKDLIREYLNIAINSDHIFLFSCRIKNEIVGYALLAKKPKFLIIEFSDLKFKILFNLIKKMKLILLLNIIISLFRFDLLFLKKKNKDLIKSSLNLNLLAIKKQFQSTGIGKTFSQNIFKKIHQDLYKFDTISVEAPNMKSCNFYLNKLNFRLIGKKIRLFKFFFVLLKEKS